jgi:hypothetical protein
MKNAGLVFLLGGLLVAAGCGKTEMDSAWRTQEIAIDGRDGDWQGALAYVAKEKAVVSLLNDGEFLYLRLASADRATQAQVMRFGFTVWFDAKGGERKTFGIRFPQGARGRGRPFAAREGGEGPESGPEEGGPRELPEPLPAIVPDQLEIIGPGEGERLQVREIDARGIDLEVAQAGGRLVYELKIPLVRDDDHPYGLGIRPGQQFSLGFETATPDREAMREGRGEGGRGRGGPGGGIWPGGGGRGGGAWPGGAEPGGVMPGGRGGRGGMGAGGRRSPGEGGMSQALQLWVKVKLAAGEALTEPDRARSREQ